MVQCFPFRVTTETSWQCQETILAVQDPSPHYVCCHSAAAVSHSAVVSYEVGSARAYEAWIANPSWYQLHSSVSWFWLEQVLEGSHDPNDRCPVLPHWQGCYRRQRSGGPTLLILSLFSQTGNLYLDVEMQTYIFRFTPRIRLDCTNEIKNWISCEERKGKPVKVCTVLG